MTSIALNAKSRTNIGKKARALRADGGLPAVTYGHGIKAQALELSAKEFAQVFAKAGSSTLVSLKLGDGEKNVVIHAVQHDPVSGSPIHVDLYQVRMDEKIKAQVPLKFVGVSRAVKDLGGILVKPTETLEVEALPADLPHEIVVDLSKLEEINAKLTLKDLALPAAVRVLVDDPEYLVATVDQPRSEEELAKLDEAVTEDVEAVEGVKKPVEGEEVAAEGEEDKEGKEVKKTEPEAGAKVAGKAAPEAAKSVKPEKSAQSK